MYWGKKKGVKWNKYSRKMRKGRRPAGIMWSMMEMVDFLAKELKVRINYTGEDIGDVEEDVK